MRARPLSIVCSVLLALTSASIEGCKRRRPAHTRNQVTAAQRARPFTVVNDSDGDGLADVLLADAPLGAQLLSGSREAPLSRARWRWSMRADDPARVRARAMAFVGDLDGDRKSEVAIAQSSVRADNPCEPGGVRIHYGSASTGLSPQPAWWLDPATPMGEGTDHYALIGAQLARVDDIDGPRTAGLVVSARRTRVLRGMSRLADDGGDGDGDVDGSALQNQRRSEFCEGDELWVYRGATRAPSQRIVLREGAVERVVVGRLDMDAYPELVVLARPRVLIYRGRPGGFEESPARVIDDPHDEPMRWSDVAVGDLDGDGAGDVVLTLQYTSTSEGATRAAVVHFNALMALSDQRFVLAPTASVAEGALGRSLILVRDQNGDRRDELVIADPVLRAVLVYAGRAEHRYDEPTRVLRVPENAGALGVTLIDAGDVDGDRRDELLVRASRDDGGMSTLYLGEALRGELERVAIEPGAEGFAWSIAGRSSALGGPGPRELAPLPRRCVVPSSESEAARLVTIEPAMVRVDAAAVDAALQAKLGAVAACHERSLQEDCNRSAVASATLVRDASTGALTVSSVAWQSETTDALRDCVEQALRGTLIERSREGSDGPVTLRFHEVP